MLTSLALPLLALFATVDAQQLSDGNWMQSGSISSTLKWQSSGKLTSGSCDRKLNIRPPCYTISLGGYGTNLQSTTQAQYQASLAAKTTTSSGSSFRTLAAVSEANTIAEPTTQAEWAALAASDDTNLYAYYKAFPPKAQGELIRRQVVSNCSSGGPPPDPNHPPPPPPPPSPRQRVEFLAWPGAKAGERWKYTWKTNHQKTSIGPNFNHIWQILRRDACGGPVITLDLKNDQAVLIDTLRSCPSGVCASTPISNWWGVTIQHTMTIRFGVRGTIDYTAQKAGLTTGTPLLSYSARGDMGADASLKTGTYRLSAVGMLPSTSYVGEWTATLLS